MLVCNLCTCKYIYTYMHICICTQISAKYGTGIQDLLESIIVRIPHPTGNPKKPLRMLLFDSWYNQYRGVICLIAVVDGSVKRGMMSHDT